MCKLNRSCNSVAALVAAWLVAMCVITGVARAQGPVIATDDQNAQLDAVFERLLAQPDDVPTILEYARLSATVGDFEGAIGALERLLLISSNEPVVRADLGVFYYRLGF